MEETELVPSDAKFRQGDILKLYGAPHANYGVVINADCDLANDKIDGYVAYVPLYTFQDFIDRFWSHDQITAITKQCRGDLIRIFKSEKEVEDLASWLVQVGPDEVFEKLKPDLDLKKNQLEELGKLLRKLHACFQGKSFECLKAIYSLEANPEKHAQTQLSALKSNLGEGHMMISSITGTSDLGFIIRMKRVFSIDRILCFESPAVHLLNFRDYESPAAVRVARLASPYKYKLGQIFAQSFTRIGLSDEISRLSDLAILDIVENLKKVEKHV